MKNHLKNVSTLAFLSGIGFSVMVFSVIGSFCGYPLGLTAALGAVGFSCCGFCVLDAIDKEQK